REFRRAGHVRTGPNVQQHGCPESGHADDSLLRIRNVETPAWPHLPVCVQAVQVRSGWNGDRYPGSPAYADAGARRKELRLVGNVASLRHGRQPRRRAAQRMLDFEGDTLRIGGDAECAAARTWLLTGGELAAKVLRLQQGDLAHRAGHQPR